MLKTLSLVLIISISLIGNFAGADVLSLKAKIGQWRPDFEGHVTTSVIDIHEELGLDSDKGLLLEVKLEHPVPILPNVRIAHTNLENSGSGTVLRTFEFGGESFTAGTAVDTDIDLTHTDITLYYEVIDIVFDLDLGITARKFDGNLKIDSADLNLRTIENVDYWVPMGYLAARYDIPFFGFYVTGNINGIGYSDSHLIDYSIAGGWQTSIAKVADVGVEIGYRALKLDLAEDDVGDFDSNIDINGVFGNLAAYF